MPTLSSKPITFEILEPQLLPSTLVAIQSMQLLADRISETCIEPARLIAERINKVCLEPWRQISESISRMMEVQNKIMIQALAAELTFNKLFPNGLFNLPPSTFKAASIFGTANIIEGEIEEVKETPLGSEVLETALILRQVASIAPVTTIQTKANYLEVFERFNTALTIEGRLYFEDILLKYISSNSKQGQFLILLLEASDNYVTDELALSKLSPADTDKGLGYIRDDLFKYLAKDGLSIGLYRARKKGYKLLKISRLNN